MSSITKLEVLGFRQLTAEDKLFLESVFKARFAIAINDAVIEQAILLRQVRKMSVGDAIIAATALLNNRELYTNNTADFTHIAGLTVINPLSNSKR